MKLALATVLLSLLLVHPSGASHPCAFVVGGFKSQRLVFTGVGGRDVYNPTKPFDIVFKGKLVKVMAARVEARDSEVSESIFFTERDGTWSPLVDAPVFKMQDPFFTFINEELVLGGVEIYPRPDRGYGYKTIFFRGNSLESLKPFAEGPAGMKDIRLVQLKDGKIGLFTRPQGMIPGTDIDAGPGKIGFTIIGSLAELTIEGIFKAPLLEGQFSDGAWGGVNEAQLLADGRIAVLAHAAHFDARKNRHYHSVVFTIDPASGGVSQLEIILKRKDLARGLRGNSKRNDLKDVVFSGGLFIMRNHAIIYVGAGDAEVHVKLIPLPNSFK